MCQRRRCPDRRRSAGRRSAARERGELEDGAELEPSDEEVAARKRELIHLARVERGQPIFAVDDATAESIRATFVLDMSLIRSFGRKKGNDQLGITDKQQELLVSLALWKVQQLLESPFRYRSGCHLRRAALQCEGEDAEIKVNVEDAVKAAGFSKQPITDVFWPREELYREGAEDKKDTGANDDEDDSEDGDDA